MSDATGFYEITDFRAFLDGLREHLASVFAEQREAWQREGPAVEARAAALGIAIATKGGNCPVQIEGTVDGQPFYFRARGAAWECWIGGEGDWFTDRAWSVERPYGSWPEAGWMPLHEAIGFLCDAVEEWRAGAAGEAAGGNAHPSLGPQ